jgi:hypothetical protein
MLNDVTKSFSNAFKISMVVMFLGLMIAIFKSAAIFGIIFLSATYMGYVVVGSIVTGIISFFASFFTRKKMETELGLAPGGAPWPEPPTTGFRGNSTAEATDPVELVMAVMAKMTPEQLENFNAKIKAAGKAGKG